MRWLLDENTGRDLPRLLPEHGIDADHILDLRLGGTGDPAVLDLALAEYGLIVTKDRFGKRDPRSAALTAMRDGLRILELRFTGKAPDSPSGTTAEQLELILGNLDRIEDLIQPDSTLRKLILNGSTGTATKVMDVEEVAAEIARLGL